MDTSKNESELLAACEESSFCNCEGSEKEIPYVTEDSPEDDALADTCRTITDRILADWKQANGNPYIKKISTCRVDIYRKPTDATPIDSYYTEHVKGYSLGKLVLIGTAAALALLAVGKIWFAMKQ